MIVLRPRLDTLPPGVATREALAAEWGPLAGVDGLDTGRVSVLAGESGPFLRVAYPKGVVGPRGGGAQWLAPLPARHDQLFLDYRLRFAPGFDFMLGGKLPGLVGGTANTGGNPPNGRDGFSARMMWREQGAVVQYVYHPDQRGVWGDDLAWDRRFQPGRWHRVRHQLTLNRPGASDGRVRGWFDGELALDARGLRFRDTPELGIDQLYFSTFFGGNDGSWAPSRDEHVDFADFVVSTEPPQFAT